MFLREIRDAKWIVFEILPTLVQQRNFLMFIKKCLLNIAIRSIDAIKLESDRDMKNHEFRSQTYVMKLLLFIPVII